MLIAREIPLCDVGLQETVSQWEITGNDKINGLAHAS